SGEQETGILVAGIPGSQPGPANAAQADGGGVRRLQARVKSERHRPERGTLAVGWFGDRTRILPGTGIEVKRFQVWQDLSGPGYDDVAPLHATVTLEMSNEWYSSLTTSDGTIRIDLVGCNEVVEAKLVLHNAHHDLDPSQLGSKRILQFVV